MKPQNNPLADLNAMSLGAPLLVLLKDKVVTEIQKHIKVMTAITHLPFHSLCSPALQRTQCSASVGDDVAQVCDYGQITSRI